MGRWLRFIIDHHHQGHRRAMQDTHSHTTQYSLTEYSLNTHSLTHSLTQAHKIQEQQASERYRPLAQ